MNKLSMGAILKYTGGVTMFIGIVGGILGANDYVLRYRGATLPQIDPIMGACFGVLGAGLFYWGWKMEKDKAKAESEEKKA